MSSDFVIIVICVIGFAVLIGRLVKLMLDIAERKRLEARMTGAEELLARAAKADESGFTPAFIRGIMRARRAELIRKGLPDALDMIANSLTAGLTLPQALLRNLEHFPPGVGEEFARVIYDTRLGYSVAAAFVNLSERLPTSDIRMIATASEIGVAHGGNLADSYHMLSKLLRDNMAFESELRAMTTEGRMQALVMSILPFAMMIILGAVNPQFIVPMVTTVAGWGTICVLLLMQGLAYLWIRVIVDIKV